MLPTGAFLSKMPAGPADETELGRSGPRPSISFHLCSTPGPARHLPQLKATGPDQILPMGTTQSKTSPTGAHVTQPG